MRRAIFPLPIVILPEGVTRLKIFEQRYLRMVREAAKADTGFVICLYQEDEDYNLSKLGTLVKIVDFESDDQGQLLIDVEGQSIVSLSSPSQEQDGLRFADCEDVQSDWQQEAELVTTCANEHAHLLKQVFAEHPELAKLYKTPHFDDKVWVLRRWIELLPLSPTQKAQLGLQSNFKKSFEFLHSVLEK